MCWEGRRGGRGPQGGLRGSGRKGPVALTQGSVRVVVYPYSPVYSTIELYMSIKSLSLYVLYSNNLSVPAPGGYNNCKVCACDATGRKWTNSHQCKCIIPTTCLVLTSSIRKSVPRAQIGIRERLIATLQC